jgi:DNA-binding IclR family transcriptional regulator
VTLSQTDLALLTGLSRESVSRVVRTLTSIGRLERERRGRYVVRSQLRLVAQ